MSVWRDDCQRLIAKLVADLPPEADWKERKKLLWGKGWEAHRGTSWGRKMWGREVRKHLAAYGGPGSAGSPPDPDVLARLESLEQSGEIYLPFRKKPDDSQT